MYVYNNDITTYISESKDVDNWYIFILVIIFKYTLTIFLIYSIFLIKIIMYLNIFILTVIFLDINI